VNIFLDANICLDLLDTTRPNSKISIAWYMKHKDDSALSFYFSGDFITTFYYILTERRKIDKQKVVHAIESLSLEVTPFYINHSDFLEAKDNFGTHRLDDFEDLLIAHSGLRCECGMFMTNDKDLLSLKKFDTMQIKKV